jgi:hypothetical protein
MLQMLYVMLLLRLLLLLLMLMLMLMLLLLLLVSGVDGFVSRHGSLVCFRVAALGVTGLGVEVDTEVEGCGQRRRHRVGPSELRGWLRRIRKRCYCRRPLHPCRRSRQFRTASTSVCERPLSGGLGVGGPPSDDLIVSGSGRRQVVDRQGVTGTVPRRTAGWRDDHPIVLVTPRDEVVDRRGRLPAGRSARRGDDTDRPSAGGSGKVAESAGSVSGRGQNRGRGPRVRRGRRDGSRGRQVWLADRGDDRLALRSYRVEETSTRAGRGVGRRIERGAGVWRRAAAGQGAGGGARGRAGRRGTV